MPKKFVFGNQAVTAYDRRGKAVNVAPAMNLAGGTVNIMIWGEISDWWGVNSRDVYWALKGQNVSQINVFISSPGGEPDQAFVIHDMLQGHPANVTAYLVGQCASAATIVSCSADEVVISNQCIYMIHKPNWGLWGDADELRKGAEILDKYQSLIINVYKRKTGIEESRLNELMNAETWFEPSEALALGFVDSVVDHIEVDFLLPTTGADSPDTESSTFDNVSTYRVAALAALEMGMRPANKADIQKFVPRTKSNTMFGKDFFTNILNFLNGEKALAKNADVDELAQTLADDETLTAGLETSAVAALVKAEVAALVKAEVAKNKAEALTIEALAALVEGATPEAKQKIAVALNQKPVEAKKATAKKADGDDDEESGDEEEEEDGLAALNKKFGDLQAELAKMKKGGSPTSSTNGGSSVKDSAKPTTKEGRADAAKKQLVLSALEKNTITREQYKNITGEEAPTRSKG